MKKHFNGFTLAEGATHVAMPKGQRFSAFTLAEVLITLGIIGVVAAMTMPTLINQTNGAQYKAAYKKALSAIAQGVTLNVALDGGSFADTDQGKPGTDDPGQKKKGGNGEDKDTLVASGGESIASILVARMNRVKTTGTAHTGYPASDVKVGETAVGADTFIYFNDGSMFGFKSTDSKCTLGQEGNTDKVCFGVIDVNGAKGPNKVVTCSGSSDTNEALYSATGKAATTGTCTVSNPTDIYPVAFFDQTILPATTAAAAVLYGK